MMPRTRYAKVEISENEIVVRIPFRQEIDIIPHREELTRREKEVLEALGPNRTRSDKEIAQTLGIGVRTVKFHMQELLRKFGVKSRQEL
jgi:DNA-binding NarL/FixJ family response regulator